MSVTDTSYNASAYIAPYWTSSSTIDIVLTFSDEGGASVTEAHISSSPNFTTYTTVALSTSPQTVSYTLSDVGTDGKKYVYVRYKNSNGILSSTYSLTVYLDTEPPTVPGQPFSFSSWSTTDNEGNPQIVWNWTASYDANGVTSYTVQIEEDNGSGYVLKKEDGTTNTSYVYKDLQDGADYRIKVKAIDLVGRESGWSKYSSAVTADTEAPHDASINILDAEHNDITETSYRNVVLKVAATEDADESGIKRVRFRNKPLKVSFNGSTIEYQVSEWSSWYDFTSSPLYYDWVLSDDVYGSMRVEAQIQDAAGNSVYVYDDVEVLRGFIIDTVPPTGSVEINDGLPSTNNPTVKLNISGSDATTGILAMRFRDSDRNWSDWEPFDATRYYSMETTEGLKVVEVQLKDYGGNVVDSCNQLFTKKFLDPANDTESTYLSYERISEFVIHDGILYAFSKGSSSQGVYAKIYQFLNNEFVEIYEFSDEEEYEVSAAASFGDNIYIATSKTSAAKVYAYNVSSAAMAVSSNFGGLEDAINALEVYGNKLYAGSGDGYVYVFDGAAWSTRADAITIDTQQDQVVDLQVYNNYLHIATGNSGNMYTYDGNSLSSAMTTAAQAIDNLTIVNDMLVGISQSTNEIYIYRERLDNTIWNERVLFNREPDDDRNSVVWNKFSSGDPQVNIVQGVMEIYCPQGSTLLYIQSEVGHTWVDGVSNSTGWTLQMTVSYNGEDSEDGPQGIRFSDGTYGAELRFTSSVITLNYGVNSASHVVNMSTPHEIRVVGQGTNLKVFIDRTLAISVTDWGATDSTKKLELGDLSLYSASRARWDTFRISTTGAYEPTDIASRSDITVIPWYSNSVISSIVTMDAMINATDIEDEVTTVLVNDASIADVTTEIDDTQQNIQTLTNYIGGDAYEQVLSSAIDDDRISDTDYDDLDEKFVLAQGAFSNISSLLTTIKADIASKNEINIQDILTELDSIVVNVGYYAIYMYDIITESIPELPSPRDSDEVDALLEEIDNINDLLDSYIVSLTNMVSDLSAAGDEVYIAARNASGQAQIWSTYDFSTYSLVVTLDDNVNATYAMKLFPTDNVGSRTENRVFVSSYDSNTNHGYVKLIRDSYIADDVLLDTTPPTGTIIISPNGTAEGASKTNSNIVTIRITGSDTLSGVKEYALSANNDFSGSAYNNWVVNPTWVNNYNLTSTETAFVEIEDFNNDILSIVEFNNAIYIGTSGGNIYRSLDLETFTQVFTGSSAVNCMAVHDNKIYAGLQSGVLLESSNGNLGEWTTKSVGLLNASGGIDVVPIYCMASIDNTLYIGGGNSLLNAVEFGALGYVYNFSEVAVLSITSFVKSGSTYIMVGTSDAGKIFMFDPNSGAWTVSYNTTETGISALSSINLDDLDDDAQYVIAGSYPGGKLYLYTVSDDSWEMFHDTADNRIWSMANMALGSGDTTYPAVVIGTGDNGRIFVFRKMNNSPRVIALYGNLDADVIYSLAMFGDNMYAGTGNQGKLFKYDGSLVGNGVRTVYLSLRDRAGNVSNVDIYDEIELELLYENMLMEIDSGGNAQFIYTAGDSKLYSGYKIENEYGIYESIDFTGGADFNQWCSLSWTGDAPAGTSVEIYVKTADTKAGLATADYNGPYTNKTGNDISELRGSWIKFKIVLKTSIVGVTPYVESLVISYYAAESAHFYTTLFNLTSNITDGIATWTATIPTHADIKVGIATEDTTDWNDYQIISNNESFSIASPNNKFRVGIKFIASGDEAPSLDEFAIAWNTLDNSIDLVNKD